MDQIAVTDHPRTPAQEKSWWRAVLGEYPTGVTIITSVDGDGAPVGMVVGTFTSVSEDPPLVGFLPMTSSRTFQHIERTGRFRASVLGAAHEELCRSFFSAAAEDRFAIGDWEYDQHGIPRLRDAVAWFDAAIDRVHPAGDHSFVLGSVEELGLGSGQSGMPLLFLKGGYGSFTVPRLDFDLTHFGDQLRHAAGLRDRVAALAQAFDVECILTSVARDSVVVLTAANLRSPLVGVSFPFAAPMAPVFAAWSSPERRRLWVDSARDLLGSVDPDFVDGSLREVRERGYSVSAGEGIANSFDAIVGSPRADRAGLASLWTRVTEDHRRLSESDHPEHLVDSVQVPVFGPDGTAELELVVDGVGPGCAPERYHAVIDAALVAGADLTRQIGGRPPSDYRPTRSWDQRAGSSLAR